MNNTKTIIENFSNSSKKENEIDENSHDKIKFIDGKIISYSNSNKFNILFDTKKKLNNK